jgi:hypothetical protein
MDAVFGLVPGTRLRAIDHRIGDFFTAMRGQAVEKNRVALGVAHQPVIDLIRRHRGKLVVGTLEMRLSPPKSPPGSDNSSTSAAKTGDGGACARAGTIQPAPPSKTTAIIPIAKPLTRAIRRRRHARSLLPVPIRETRGFSTDAFVMGDHSEAKIPKE